MRRFSLAAAPSIMLLIVACGGTPTIDSPAPTAPAAPTATPAASPSPSPTASPTPTPTPIPTPTATLTTAEPTAVSSPSPAAGTGNECSAIPTFDPSAGLSFTPDEELEAAFPSEVAGQRVQNLQSFRWLEFVCAFAGQAAVDQATAQMPPGFDMTHLSMATAAVAFDDGSVNIVAMRLPGQDAQAMIRLSVALSGQTTGQPDGGSISPETIGGKQVYAVQQDDGAGYVYPVDDIVFVLSDIDEARAAELLSALP